MQFTQNLYGYILNLYKKINPINCLGKDFIIDVFNWVEKTVKYLPAEPDLQVLELKYYEKEAWLTRIKGIEIIS